MATTVRAGDIVMHPMHGRGRVSLAPGTIIDPPPSPPVPYGFCYVKWDIPGHPAWVDPASLRVIGHAVD